MKEKFSAFLRHKLDIFLRHFAIWYCEINLSLLLFVNNTLFSVMLINYCVEINRQNVLFIEIKLSTH
jgi:hypothetical protein